MKKQLFKTAFAAVFVWMVCATGLSAQTWTGNAPQAGDYYLYNVGAKKLLTSGCWWGTHAAMDDDGMLLAFTAADGGYTISTAAAYGGNHYLGSNAYMDNGTAATWTFTQVGATNKYTMKNGDNYLVYVSGAVADNTTTAPTTDAGYWQIVSRADLINNMKSATPSSPVDASFFMTNPKIRRNWSNSKPFSGEGFSDNGSFNANDYTLYGGGCTSVGQYRKTFDNYQALTGLPNGKYQVTVKGFNRLDGGDYNTAAYMYANNETTTLPTMGNIGTENADYATRALVDNTYLTSPVTVTVTDGNLRVGVKCDANCGWVTWREFTIKFLDPQLSFAAETLPATDVTAGKWYAYNIFSAGDYKITSSAATTLTYTQDGTQLASTATETSETFTAGQTKTVSLTEGTVYIKSSAASTLQIVKNSESVIADGIYYLKDQNGKYIARGSSYGTRAYVNDFGLPLKITTDASGVTTLQYYDSDLYVFVTGDENEEHSVYADNSIHNGWTVTKNGSVYNLQSTYTNTYLTVSSDGNLDLGASAYNWIIESGSEHAAQMTALKNTQAVTAATAAGLTGVTTVSDLESAVSPWNVTNVITAGNVTTTAESYQPFYNWSSTLTTYSADVAITASGLYRLTIQGFGRLAGNDKVYALHQENADVSPFYAFFGSATTPLMSVMDLGSNGTNYGNNCVSYGGNYYPNGQASALAAFQDNKYVNTIWVYIPTAGTYSYGIKIDGSASVDNGRWTCYTTESVSLTLYSQDLWGPLQAALETYAPYSDIAATDDVTGYTTQYNTYAAYTQSTSQSDMLAAITYMQNNYANYQWANASIAHPVDVTERIITDADCTNNDNWNIGLTGRQTYPNEQDETGTTRTLFGQVSEPNPVRGQTVTIPSVGAYMLKTWVRTVNNNANTYAKIAISTGAWNGDGTYANAEDIAAAYGNESAAWRQVTNYFATTTENQQKTIYLNMSHGGEGRRAYVSRMALYYIGQKADFVKDGVHKYIGKFATAPAITLTDAEPVADIKGATFTSGSSALTFTNPNGLVFANAAAQVNSTTKNVVVNGTCSSLQLEKGHPFINPTEFTATAAKYAVAAEGELAGGRFATLMIPFNATTLPGTAYTLNNGVDLMGGTLKGTVASSIDANSPVLVTAAGDYTGSNVTVPVVAQGATYTNGQLVGTYSPMTAVEGSYVLQNHDPGEGVAFYLVGSTKPTVNPFRAYIKPQGSNARALKVVFDDAQGISTTLNDNGQMTNDIVYDLQGRRVAQPTKGLYIVNGRKTVIK